MASPPAGFHNMAAGPKPPIQPQISSCWGAPCSYERHLRAAISHHSAEPSSLSDGAVAANWILLWPIDFSHQCTCSCFSHVDARWQMKKKLLPVEFYAIIECSLYLAEKISWFTDFSNGRKWFSNYFDGQFIVVVIFKVSHTLPIFTSSNVKMCHMLLDFTGVLVMQWKF